MSWACLRALLTSGVPTEVGVQRTTISDNSAWACLLAAQRKFTKGCSASPKGASGRRQASSVVNLRTRQGCPHLHGVGRQVVHHGDTGAAPINGGWGSGGGASYASHRNINMSGCAVPNHTAKPCGARQKSPVRFLYRALNLPMKKPEKSKKYRQKYPKK